MSYKKIYETFKDELLFTVLESSRKRGRNASRFVLRGQPNQTLLPNPDKDSIDTEEIPDEQEPKSSTKRVNHIQRHSNSITPGDQVGFIPGRIENGSVLPSQRTRSSREQSEEYKSWPP